MAMAAGMFPGLAEAFSELNTEHVRIDGTPIVSDIKVESVKSPEQMAEAEKSQDYKASGGGLRHVRGLAKKLEKKAEGGDKNGNGPRTTAMTTHNEVLSVSTSVGADEVAIPVGFKEKH